MVDGLLTIGGAVTDELLQAAHELTGSHRSGRVIMRRADGAELVNGVPHQGALRTAETLY